jgi:Ca2+-binding EF-hand superfamily protein
MKKTIIAIASVIGLSMSGAALAQDLDFAALDADVSGGVSLSELQVALPDITEEEFASYDLDGSGELSEEELAAVVSVDADAMSVEGEVDVEAPAAQ